MHCAQRYMLLVLFQKTKRKCLSPRLPHPRLLSMELDPLSLPIPKGGRRPHYNVRHKLGIENAPQQTDLLAAGITVVPI